MKLKVCLTAAALCAFALTAVAQHDHSAHSQKPAGAPQMDPAMMDAMMKAGIPGDPHKKLDGMVGTWNTKITMWMMPGADPMTSSGTSTNQWIMGGRYLEQRFKGDFMGMPFEGIGFTGYDNVKKRYWGTWMDNMSTSIMTSTGTASADGKVWDFDGTMSDPMTGGDTAVKEKVTITDADNHLMEMWAPGPDGKMFKNMEIAYSRK
ncbi:MAG TPA: DUF1579 domain-containing protein [Thermoanaerobaculia bacterium]|nr:DUF1579 domain-containing protein [Thermoanaerobaculia bacterium]